MRNVRNVRTEVDSSEGYAPHFAQFAESAAHQEPELTRMDIDTSLISHSSLGLVENLSEDKVEVLSTAGTHH